MDKKDFKMLMYALYGNKQLIIPDGQTLQQWIDNAFVEKKEQAINYTHCCETLKDKEIPTFEQYRNLIYKNKMHGFINKETSRYMDYEDMETRYNWLLKNL